MLELLTVKRLCVTLNTVNCEVRVSAKIGTPALENFQLFYEEITHAKPVKRRIRRARALRLPSVNVSYIVENRQPLNLPQNSA